jgi:hypothetical protein
MGFVLFCLVLKWQPWNSRLMMPVLILAMPVVGVTLSARLKGTSIYLLGLIVAVVAIPYLVLNPTRPLIGHDSVLFRDRMLQYFANVPDDATSYEAAARMLRDANCSLVGLASPTDGREYLLWVTNRVFNPAVQIEHVMVKNISRRYAVNFTPCAIVVTYPVQESELRYQNTDYVTTLSTERFSLFLRPLAPP